MTDREELERISVRLPIDCVNRIDQQVEIEKEKQTSYKNKRKISRTSVIKDALKIGLAEMDSEAIA
jgi:Arc/MetJ-type ribon-helix-helix transcriptional regulator